MIYDDLCWFFVRNFNLEIFFNIFSICKRKFWKILLIYRDPQYACEYVKSYSKGSWQCESVWFKK